MVRGTWIILEGPGGELDRTFIADVEGQDPDLEVELVSAIQDRHWAFNAGDSVRFVEGSSEKPDWNA